MIRICQNDDHWYKQSMIMWCLKAWSSCLNMLSTSENIFHPPIWHATLNFFENWFGSMIKSGKFCMKNIRIKAERWKWTGFCVVQCWNDIAACIRPADESMIRYYVCLWYSSLCTTELSLNLFNLSFKSQSIYIKP